MRAETRLTSVRRVLLADELTEIPTADSLSVNPLDLRPLHLSRERSRPRSHGMRRACMPEEVLAIAGCSGTSHDATVSRLAWLDLE